MVNIVKKYLEKSNYRDQREDFELFFLSHPNYPSALAISDSLDSLSVPNEVVKVPKEQFVELPETFLTLFKQEMVLVKKMDSFVIMEWEGGSKSNVNFNDFLSGWDQIVILVEPNEVIDIKSGRLKIKGLGYILPLFLLVLFSVICNDYNTGSLALLFTSVFGLVISLFILREKFGYNSPIVSKICSITPGASCQSIIQSDNEKKRIHFSDLPFLFFGISVLAIAIEPANSAMIVGLLSVFSLPIVLYSIWVQKTEYKRWCVLCLAVSLIIGVQVLVFVLGSQSFPPVFSISFFEFAIFALFFTTSWALVKPVFEAKRVADQDLVQAIRFKRNYAVFNFLSTEVPSVRGLKQLKGLNFGDGKAAVRLTLILSPSCGLCHKALEQALELVEKFPRHVALKVLFNVNPENTDNPFKMVVEQLVALNNTFPVKATEAMNDWFVGRMRLPEWKAKWAGNIIDMKVKHQVRQQFNWCSENEFNYTPVTIVNDKLLPEGYEISDLKYFLKDFIKEIDEAENGVLAKA